MSSSEDASNETPRGNTDHKKIHIYTGDAKDNVSPANRTIPLTSAFSSSSSSTRSPAPSPSLQESDQLLASRFRTLKFNHDELTKIKDEYKAENAKLRKENEMLRQENRELFSPKISALESQLEDEREKHEVMVGTLRELVDKMEANKKATKVKEEEAEKRQESLKMQINDLRLQLDSITRQAQESDEKNVVTLSELQSQSQKFQENKKSLIDQYEKKLQQLHDSRSTESEAIASLKRDMIRVEGEKNLLRQDFDIYKRHANYLLMKERELNARIRTVLDCTKCTGKDTS